MNGNLERNAEFERYVTKYVAVRKAKPAILVKDDMAWLMRAFPWLKRLIQTGDLPTKDAVVDSIRGGYSGYEPELYTLRDVYTALFGFPLITREVVDEVCTELKGRRVLEVCAGGAYLTRLLHDRGISVIATDNKSWATAKTAECWQWQREPFLDVQDLEATEAIRRYREWADVIYMSWPPYQNPVDLEVLKLALEYQKPILLQHEGRGTAPAPTGSTSWPARPARSGMRCRPISRLSACGITSAGSSRRGETGVLGVRRDQCGDGFMPSPHFLLRYENFIFYRRRNFPILNNRRGIRALGPGWVTGRNNPITEARHSTMEGV